MEKENKNDFFIDDIACQNLDIVEDICKMFLDYPLHNDIKNKTLKDKQIAFYIRTIKEDIKIHLLVTRKKERGCVYLEYELGEQEPKRWNNRVDIEQLLASVGAL